MVDVVNINGKIIPAEHAFVSVLDHGFLYGDGIFDTFRIYNHRALYLKEHVNRLYYSAKGVKIKITLSKRKLIKEIIKTYSASQLPNAFVRIIVTRGICGMGLGKKADPTIIIMIVDRPDHEEPVSLIVSKNLYSNSGYKTLNYMENVVAKIEAKEKGFDDAIFINRRGFLAEATTSNIFVVKDGKLFTPIFDILNGITRNAIVKQFKVFECNLRICSLYDADEVFLTGTVAGIVPVIQIEDKKLEVGSVTKKVMAWYEKQKGRGTKLD